VVVPQTGTDGVERRASDRAGASFGAARPQVKQRIQVEMISANPTGPVTVASARNGAIGDSVARLLAKYLGVKVEFVPTSWDTLGAGIAADKYDICASGITMTLERLKSVAFSDPYLDSPLVPLILKKDDGKFASWRDMDKAGVKLAVMAGTSAEESAKKSFTKAEIVSITAPALDYQELLAGRVTAAITDTIFIKKALAQYADQVAVVGLDKPIEGQPISMMTLQGDQVWLNWVNTWIKLKQQTGFFDSLFNKWIAG